MPSNLMISGRYEIVGAVPRAGGRSYFARHAVLGHEVMVHFLTRAGGGQSLALLDKVMSLDEETKRLFIDAGEHDNAPFIVSWHLPAFDTLARWLERASFEPGSQLPDSNQPAHEVAGSVSIPTAPELPPRRTVATASPAEQSAQEQRLPPVYSVNANERTSISKPSAKPQMEAVLDASGTNPDPSAASEQSNGDPGTFTRVFGLRPGPDYAAASPPPTTPAALVDTGPVAGSGVPQQPSPLQPSPIAARREVQDSPPLPQEFLPANRNEGASFAPSVTGSAHVPESADSDDPVKPSPGRRADTLPPPAKLPEIGVPVTESIPAAGKRDAGRVAPSNSSYTQVIGARGNQNSSAPAHAPSGPGSPDAGRLPLPSGLPNLPGIPSAPKLPPVPKPSHLPLPKNGATPIPVWLGVALFVLFIAAVLLVLFFVLRRT